MMTFFQAIDDKTSTRGADRLTFEAWLDQAKKRYMVSFGEERYAFEALYFFYPTRDINIIVRYWNDGWTPTEYAATRLECARR